MLRSVSIRTRLMLLVSIPLLILAAISVTALIAIAQQHASINTLYHDRVEPLKEIKTTSDMYGINIVDLLHKYRGDMVSAQELRTGIQQARDEASQEWSHYKNTQLNSDETELVRIADRQLVVVNRLIDQLLTEIDDNSLHNKTPPAFMLELYGAFDPLTKALDDLIHIQLDVADDYVIESQQSYEQVEIGLAVVCGGVLLALMVLGTLVYQSISHPIRDLMSDLNHIASKSDLRHRIKENGSDELTRLAKTQNQMLERFHGILRHLRDAVQQATVASEEMSAIARQVSQTVNNQNDQLISVTSSITQMSGAVREVANSASETAHQANIAKDQTHISRQQVSTNVTSISRLSECVERSDNIVNRLHHESGAISEVLTVIRSIAEQTNLLALNAAIESARAGEAGRGFAVVADEVRALAQNTQKATASISDMIGVLQNSSMEAVEVLKEARSRASEGVSTSEVTGQLLEEISGAVGKITDMNLQVSAATEEQAVVADDVQRNVVMFQRGLDEVSENARQSAIASAEIAKLSNNLQQQIAVFMI